MWWNTKNTFKKSLGMAKETGPSQKQSGSSSSLSKRDKVDRAASGSKRVRDKKGSKTSHTVNIADRNKPNNKSSVVTNVKNIKITPPRVVEARNRRLRARPVEHFESIIKISKVEVQQLESMGYVLSNTLAKEISCTKFRAHYLHTTESPLRQKHHLWCKVIKASNENSIHDSKLHELKMLSKLRHPHVASLHGLARLNDKIFVFTTGGTYGSVMDFLAKYGPIYENHGRVWFRQIVNALDYLHSNNIAHNDLNCETVLLSNGYNVLLSDFSSACYLSFGGKPNLSRYWNKSLYSAPEVLMGNEYNPKLAEMWSLGVILYAFYMGHPPFRHYGNEDENLATLVLNQIKRTWLRKHRAPKCLTTHAWRVIFSLLEPDVLKRAQMRHLKNSEFYIMRECVCGHGSYRTMCEEILGSLPDVYISTTSTAKWAAGTKNDSQSEMVCPLIRRYFTPRKDLSLKIEDAAELRSSSIPIGVTPIALPHVIIEDSI